jgi:hypothetical protein
MRMLFLDGNQVRAPRSAPMNRTAFRILVQSDETGAIAQLQIALDKPTFDTDGNALVTPAVATADEFESAVNALQVELDAVREQGPANARRSALTCPATRTADKSARPALW